MAVDSARFQISRSRPQGSPPGSRPRWADLGWREAPSGTRRLLRTPSASVAVHRQKSRSFTQTRLPLIPRFRRLMVIGSSPRVFASSLPTSWLESSRICQKLTKWPIRKTPCQKAREPLQCLETRAGQGAEGVGFEPTEAFASPVFKTGAINHSTTPPAVDPWGRFHDPTTSPGGLWSQSRPVRLVFMVEVARAIDPRWTHGCALHQPAGLPHPGAG